MNKVNQRQIYAEAPKPVAAAFCKTTQQAVGVEIGFALKSCPGRLRRPETPAPHIQTGSARGLGGATPQYAATTDVAPSVSLTRRLSVMVTKDRTLPTTIGCSNMMQNRQRTCNNRMQVAFVAVQDVYDTEKHYVRNCVCHCFDEKTDCRCVQKRRI